MSVESSKIKRRRHKFTDAERFWSKVKKGEKPNDCWLWTASKANGYGRFCVTTYPTHPTGAHQHSYRLAYGPIPEGMDIHHKCHTRLCVNPEHLQAVTRSENLLADDTIPARHAAKTHCPRGHPLSEDNLVKWYLKRGQRKCRICTNINQNIVRQEHKLQKQKERESTSQFSS